VQRLGDWIRGFVCSTVVSGLAWCVDAFVVDDGGSLLVPYRRDSSHLMLMMTIHGVFDVDSKSFINETSKYLPLNTYIIRFAWY
jgi:hypothetical protein